MRPIVLLYQEYTPEGTVPPTPDLNSLLTGPGYHILDYLDDKADILVATTYGTQNTANPYVAPALHTDAITIAEPPGNETGALLDASSVHLYLDEARVLIVEDNGTTTGHGFSIATADTNVLHAEDGALDLTDVLPGDYIVIQDPSSPGVAADLVKRVQSVSGQYIYTTTNFDAAKAAAPFLKARIERQVNNILVDSTFQTVSGNEIIVGGGITTILTGETVPRTVNYGKVYVEYRSLRQDLYGTVDTVSSLTEIETKLGKVDARNPLAGCAYASLQNTTTPIQFFGVPSDDLAGHLICQEIIGSRKDIYAIVPITQEQAIFTSYKTHCEGLASVLTAESTGRPQRFRVVLGNLALPTTKVISGPYTTAYHGSVDGAIPGTPIVSADDINVFVDVAGTFVTAGVRAGDSLVIVTDNAATPRTGVYTVEEVYDNYRLRIAETFAGTNKMSGSSVQYYIIRGTGTPVTGTTCVAAVATTGPNKLTADAGIVGSSSQVGNILRITDGVLPADNGDWLITASATATPAEWTPLASTQNPPVGAWTATTGIDCSLVATILSVTVARAIVTRRVFRTVRKNTATLVTDLVIATDLLQVPTPVSSTNADYDTAVFEGEVAYVSSENLVVLTADTDVPAQAPATGDSTLHFRVSRTLTKNDQVDELVSISQSYNSNRVIFVWPDSVEVAGLVDGSIARTDPATPENAAPQPGYYLAAVVGAMTAGLPPHQGFTNLGIAGIDRLYHSARYFTDTQLTTLSDGGWFVFTQDTENSLPYCIHQLTTNPTTLQYGEYSLVKNFDYIGMYYMDILDDFLGAWNITEETLGFLRQSLTTGTDYLKLRKFAKIGAPLISGTIVSLMQHATLQDRVEIYMDIVMPKPLNVIGLHLLSS